MSAVPNNPTVPNNLNRNSSLMQELKDSDWIRQSLLVPVRNPKLVLGNTNIANNPRTSQFSIASLNFADTSLGGNRSINPKYQFSDFADLPMDSLLAYAGSGQGKPGQVQTTGMGRYYCENIDANAQRIYLQFGIPAYNSLSNFFTNFYDSSHGRAANSGILSDIAFTFGKYMGYITIWSIVPGLCIANFLYHVASNVYHDFTKKPLSKFYYMKPAMALYWSSVTTIVNAISVNMHLTQPVNPNDVTKGNNGFNVNGQPTASSTGNANSSLSANTNSNTVAALARILPDIFLNNGDGIDVRAVAVRYQRLHNYHSNVVAAIKEKSLTVGGVNAALNDYLNNSGFSNMPAWHYLSFGDYMSAYAKKSMTAGAHLMDKVEAQIANVLGNAPPDTSANVNQEAVTISSNTNNVNVNTLTSDFVTEGTDSFWIGLNNHLMDFWDWTTAEFGDGSNFISFVVDFEQHVSESFSSSTRQSEVATKMNSFAREARNHWSDMAEGNIADNPIANAIEGALGLALDVGAGIADAVGLSGIALLGGKCFADIPEFWDETIVNLPSSTYTIKLRTPYGNPVSVLQDIMVPYAAILAGVAPRTTGKNSYTGPYLCKLWQEGRVQIALGLITSMSATRGTGNMGWNIYGQPVGLDVSFTVTNLSKMLHVPISAETSLKDIVGLNIFEEDNNFTDYMAVLTALGVSEQYYASSRWRLKLDLRAQNFETFNTWDNALTWMADDTLAGGIIGIFVRKGAIQ